MIAREPTLARLATGVKRFKLPPEHNFIAIYKSLNAHRDLALIFENRRQFERAAHHGDEHQAVARSAGLSPLVHDATGIAALVAQD